MKQIVFILLIFISSTTSLLAQSNFSTIDSVSIKTPSTLTDYKEIAGYLTRDLKTDIEKARAIYIWVAYNISYNFSELTNTTYYFSVNQVINEVMKNRKGICQHYAELFNAMCRSVGLKSYVITGYTKYSNGKIAPLPHAWNALDIDGNYSLVDPTWASGYTMDGKYYHEFRDEYFMIDPKVFIRSHMPFDPIWQLVNNPLTTIEFTLSDYSKLEKKGNFNYKDSIQNYANANCMEQLINSDRRIVQNGENNSMIRKQLNENKRQINNISLNLAVDTMNYGVDRYNEYIQAKNKQFRNPKLSDEQIKKLITEADQSFKESSQLVNRLHPQDALLKKQRTGLLQKLNNLSAHLAVEEDFVTKYLKFPKAVRRLKFYQFRP